MDEENKPKRYHELVAIHGHLDPLVNVDMEPATQVKVRFEIKFLILENLKCIFFLLIR